jgi:hypothetical protein
MSEIADGVPNTMHLVVDTQFATVTGRYFDQDAATRANAQAYDPKARAKLRALAMRLTGLEGS